MPTAGDGDGVTCNVSYSLYQGSNDSYGEVRRPLPEPTAEIHAGKKKEKKQYQCLTILHLLHLMRAKPHNDPGTRSKQPPGHFRTVNNARV